MRVTFAAMDYCLDGDALRSHLSAACHLPTLAMRGTEKRECHFPVSAMPCIKIAINQKFIADLLSRS